MEQSKSLALAAISLTFESEVTWDLDMLVNDALTWLNGTSISNTSKVGILSSPKLLELLDFSSGMLVAPSAPNFQRMIYATSLAYTHPVEPPLPTEVIHNIGCIAGHDLLKALDEILKPQALRDCSVNDIRALFLMVFGTIIAVGYCQPTLHDATPSQNHNARDLRSHLCQILAHYMVYLGSRLSLPILKGVDQFILEAAPIMWHKKGVFDWITPEDSDTSNDECFFDSDSGIKDTILSDVQSSPQTVEGRRVPDNSYNDEKAIPVYGFDVAQDWWTNSIGLGTLLVPEEGTTLTTERDIPETILRSESQTSWNGVLDTVGATRNRTKADSSHASMTKTPRCSMFVCHFHKKDPNFFQPYTVYAASHTNTLGLRHRKVDDRGGSNIVDSEYDISRPYTMPTDLEHQHKNELLISRTEPMHTDEPENNYRCGLRPRKSYMQSKAAVTAQRHRSSCFRCLRKRRMCSAVSDFCSTACQSGSTVVPAGIQFNFESWLKNHTSFEGLSLVLREEYIAYIAKQGVVTALIPAGEMFNRHPDMKFPHRNAIDEEGWKELRHPGKRLLV